MGSMNSPSKAAPFKRGVRDNDFGRSSQFEGRFGYIFRNLPPAIWVQAALHELLSDGQQENRMSADGKKYNSS